ncbi:MAG: peptide-methionine (S)-S-oxide reductase MsrA [bacterium]
MRYLVLLLAIVAFGCQTPKQDDVSSTPAVSSDEPTSGASTQPVQNEDPEGLAEYDLAPAGMGVATFAGGCFWCMEKPFESIDGVTAVISGYTGGPEPRPTYKQVGSGATGHTEAVRVIYDPAKVSYDLLLDVFWRNIDPTQVNGQFVDHGTQYRTGIYYQDDAQKAAAEASLKKLQASGKFDEPIVTEIKKASEFWPAETYHQDFYKKSPEHYNRYRKGSGRDQYLKKVWGDEAGGYSLHGASH